MFLHYLILLSCSFVLWFWYNVIFGGLNSLNCFSSCRNASSWANELLNFPTRTKAFLLPPDQRNFFTAIFCAFTKGPAAGLLRRLLLHTVPKLHILPQKIISFWAKSILDKSHFGWSPFWAKSILGKVHFGQSPFWTNSILGQFHSEQIPFWANSILDKFHFGQIPFWAKFILGKFHSGQIPF